jgi:hypothetical protein
MRWLGLFVAFLMATAPLAAHHNSIASDRTRVVTVEGIVESFLFANPHPEIRIRTADDRIFVAEWSQVRSLSDEGITKDTLRPGDRIIVRGRPNKVRQMSLTELAEVKRPADGWTWASPGHKF